ncbi:MAG: hypothetical protein LUF04_07010, partial [Bacteroides sp.]|nr:hypothetical protein [Bacteroides sp.]
YFASAIREVKDNGYAEFSFPDNNIPVTLTLKNTSPSHLLLSIGEKKVYLPFREFAHKMLEAALLFYETLLSLPSGNHNWFLQDRAELQELKEELSPC